MRFEWDLKKAASNLKKHGITFQEAATVFGDPLAITFHDPDHSGDDDRYLTFGLSLQNDFSWFCIRNERIARES
jgi:hypothetical protein